MSDKDVQIHDLFKDDPDMLALLVNTQNINAKTATPQPQVSSSEAVSNITFPVAQEKTSSSLPEKSNAVMHTSDITMKQQASDYMPEALLADILNAPVQAKPAEPSVAESTELDQYLSYVLNNVTTQEQAVAAPVNIPTADTMPANPYETILYEMENADTEKAEKSAKFKKPKKKTNRFLKIITNIVFYTLCLVLIVGSTIFAFSNDPQKSYFGYRFYNVLSDSMTPNEESPPGGFYAGDIIIVKMCEPEDVKVGDIITFVPGRDSRAYLTHRVVNIKTQLNNDEGLFFVTRGDANNADDPPIAADMVIGKKVLSIPKVGGVLQFIRNNFILSIVFVVSTFAFIMVLRYYFRKPSNIMPDQKKDKKGKKRLKREAAIEL